MTSLRHTIDVDAERYLVQHPLAFQAGIAEACGVSVAALGRAVRAASGWPPQEWRQRHLRTVAERFLTQRMSRSVKNVNAQLRFASQQGFARWFRRVCECLPSAHRAAHDSGARGSTEPVGKPGHACSRGDLARPSQASNDAGLPRGEGDDDG